MALGASRWRVMRQLLAETVLQALLAVALGMVFASWSLELIRNNFPPDVLRYVPGINIMGLDWATFVYSFSIAVLAGMLAGLAPALHASRPNLNDSLREGGRSASAGRARHLTRSILVVAEVALALVLLMLLRPEGLAPSSRRKAELHPESADIQAQEDALYTMTGESLEQGQR